MTFPEPLQQVDRTWVQWRGQTLAYFAGCDYFRMASRPEVLRAAEKAIREFGFNVAASRRTTGNHVLYLQLEEALADFFQSEAALLVANGYLANLAVLQGLNETFTSVMMDERSHSSLFDAAAACGLNCQTFRHKSVDDLLARRTSDKMLVLTDGMFASDGSIAPLAEYHDRLPKEALLLVDDSHGAGTLGVNGRGTAELLGVPRSRVIQTTTLSKAFGCFGGAIIANAEQCTAISERSNALGGSTPIPLPYAAAALEVCRLLKEDGPREALRQNLLRLQVSAPIIARSAGSDELREKQIYELLKRGIFPSHIRYQNGPPEGYFRFAISSEHSRAQVDALAEALSVPT